MMARRLIQTLLTLALALTFVVPGWANEQKETTGQADDLGPTIKGGLGTPKEKAVQATLAKFDKGDPGWKVRMESLVGLVKIGPEAVPVLVEALRTGSPSTREFAAQALVVFADWTTQPALERALSDPKPGVRLYAIQALSMLGPLPRTKENERILTTDPTKFGVRPMMAAALERTDKPNLAEMRKTLAEYDLRNMDSARLGQTAPDFSLTDYTGKTVRLSQFRGKTVVLRFILFDY
jgi:HEAT repeat protein